MSRLVTRVMYWLSPLAFASCVLGAVHLAAFVWLTAFRYRANVRGYVPAGFTGMGILFLGFLGLLAFMMSVGSRNGLGRHVLGTFLAVPIAVIGTSFCTGLLLDVLGYSLQADIAVSSLGSVSCLVLAVVFYVRYLSGKRTQAPDLEVAPR